MKYFSVIDTNVLVSAMLKWDSVPGSILNLAMDGPIVPVLNDAILREYRGVLSRPKFHLTDDIVSDIIESIKREAIFVDEGLRLMRWNPGTAQYLQYLSPVYPFSFTCCCI